MRIFDFHTHAFVDSIAEKAISSLSATSGIEPYTDGTVSGLREAMSRGYRIILLRESGFPEFYKPAGEAFDACAEGLLLQISPWESHMEQRTITRSQCLELIAMAERIAGGEERTA